MKHRILALFLFVAGLGFAQPPNPIPTGLSGTAYQSAVNAWLSYLYTGKAPVTSGTSILKGNGSGGFSNAASGTDYAPATSGAAILKGNGSGGFSSAASGTDYAPATSGSAILKGNGSGGFSAASAGTDYLAPNGSAASLTSFPTLNQNTTGTAANLSGTPALPNGTTATTQSQADASTKLATTAYVDTLGATKASSTASVTVNGVTCTLGSSCNTSLTTATFLLCAGPCAANEVSNWKWTAPGTRTITGCIMDAGTYPTGSGSTTVNVYKNGTTNSIFSSTALAIAGGATAYNEQTSMNSTYQALSKGDYLTAKVTAVAGTITGQYVNITCSVQ